MHACASCLRHVRRGDFVSLPRTAAQGRFPAATMAGRAVDGSAATSDVVKDEVPPPLLVGSSQLPALALQSPASVMSYEPTLVGATPRDLHATQARFMATQTPALTSVAGEWSTSSWRAKPIAQQPAYPDAAALESCLEQVRHKPALVSPAEIDRLRTLMARAAAGEAFIFQGGDCAERFADCKESAIRRQVQCLLLARGILEAGLDVPVVAVGRIAGQYAKPRSSDYCLHDGVKVEVFRGDNVHEYEIKGPDSRVPQPQRLLEGYFHSAATLNFIRSMWHDESEHKSTLLAEGDLPKVVKEAGVGSGALSEHVASVARRWRVAERRARESELFISHEGLILAYEEAMTRACSERERVYDCSAHMLWIGDRTRSIDGAHVEFFRGVANPIGVKLGPSSVPGEVVKLLTVLFGGRETEAGRVCLIVRMGCKRVRTVLPGIVDAVLQTKLPVVWLCDPMHGNTVKLPSGYKTRDLDHIVGEIKETHGVLWSRGVKLGGLHLELTGDDVTECTGPPHGTTVDDVPVRYRSYCDPRLSFAQVMRVAFETIGVMQTTKSTAVTGLANSSAGAGPLAGAGSTGFR